MDTIHAHEQFLADYALEAMSEIKGIRLLGPPSNRRGGVVSFSLKGVHPHDISQILDSDGIAIRAGHHCAMPLHQQLKISASARASFYMYTRTEDIDRLLTSLDGVRKIFRLT